MENFTQEHAKILIEKLYEIIGRKFNVKIIYERNDK